MLRVLSSFAASGLEALVEGEGFLLADEYPGEFGVGRVQEVVAIVLDDGAWDLEHSAPLAS